MAAINTSPISALPRKAVSAAIHILSIIALFVLPEVLMLLSEGPGHPQSWLVYAKVALYIAAFYINYFLIIDRTLLRQRSLGRFILSNIGVIAAAALISYLLWRLSPPPGPPGRHAGRSELHHLVRAASFIVRDIGGLILAVAFSVALKLTAYRKNLESARQRLEALSRASELESLKNQLNPHFLFNTLNTIYALIAISPDKAQKAIHELSRLLRYVLYENTSQVTLDSELSFIDNYVRLMKLRLSPSVKVDVTLDAGVYGSARIAPLLFITLIENVFKHGNTGIPDDVIKISITAADNRVVCTTVNSVVPSSDDNTRQGIGLTNLRRRLDLIYGRRAKLDVDDRAGLFTVTLTLELDTLLNKQ